MTLTKKILAHLLIPLYFLGLFSTSLIILSQVALTLIKRRSDNFRNPPFFKQRSIFPTDAIPIISQNKFKISKKSKEIDYQKLNEGFGGAYERIAYTNILKKLSKKYQITKILELNSTFIAGVPAFNSSILAQEGYDLTITVHSRDYHDAALAWKIAGLYDRVKIIKWDDDLQTPFKDKEFDLVWNHLAVEHYKDPLPLLVEMARVSKKLVVTMTLSPYNLGFISHFIWHKITGKFWDHGYIKNTLISTMEKFHKKAKLKIIESGGCDDPTTPDTVDSKMGDSMTYFDSMGPEFRKKWVWTAINPTCQNHPAVNFFWFLERAYPEWFRRLTAHHLYTASEKKVKS